jgi:hypothetical protein
VGDPIKHNYQDFFIISFRSLSGIERRSGMSEVCKSNWLGNHSLILEDDKVFTEEVLPIVFLLVVENVFLLVMTVGFTVVMVVFGFLLLDDVGFMEVIGFVLVVEVVFLLVVTVGFTVVEVVV